MGAAIGALAAILLAAVLVPLRDDVAASTSALMLVLPVVLGAVIGGRLGGALTAVVAAMSYDFFLTRPYLSLKIESSHDIETSAVLLVVGLVIGTVAAGANRKIGEAADGKAEIEAIHRVAEAAAAGSGAAAVIEIARRELTVVLNLEQCEFDRSDEVESLPTLDHAGNVPAKRYEYYQRGLSLPDPARLAVLSGGESLGSFVLHPRPRTGASRDARLAAVAIADQVAAVLAGR